MPLKEVLQYEELLILELWRFRQTLPGGAKQVRLTNEWAREGTESPHMSPGLQGTGHRAQGTLPGDLMGGNSVTTLQHNSREAQLFFCQENSPICSIQTPGYGTEGRSQSS